MKPFQVIKSIFAKSKNSQLHQLQRAVAISNIIKAGLIDRQVEILRCDTGPSELQLAICSGAVMHILAGDISLIRSKVIDLGDDPQKIYIKAHEILESDPNLEKLIVRVLYDIGSLGIMFKSLDWARGVLETHPRIDEILSKNRIKHSEMFNDHTESRFKILFEDFRNRYNTHWVEGSFFN